MSSSAADDETLAFYDSEADIYVASGSDASSRWLHSFAQRLPKGARILELGCGGGRDSAALIDLGFDVIATDGSPEMARNAQGRLGRPVRVMRFEQLSDQAAFDAIWANASLLHVPRAGLGDVLARICNALVPGGLHFASYKAGHAEGRDALGRYFNYPDKRWLTETYLGAGRWEIVSIEDSLGKGYDKVETPWLDITMRRDG